MSQQAVGVIHLELADANGQYSHGPGLVQYSVDNFHETFGTFDVGETWFYQAWFRDPIGACGGTHNVSSALSVTSHPESSTRRGPPPLLSRIPR